MKTNPQQIHESLEELKALEQQHRGTPREARIQLLLRIKENTLGTLVSFGAEVGFSEATVNRWWKVYRKQGLQALLDMRATKRTDRSDAKVIKELQRKMNAGAFTSLDDLQRWIAAKRKAARVPQDSSHDGNPATRMDAASQPELPKHVVEFLNALPTTDDVEELGKSFRDALLTLLPGVDRIVIGPNLICNLLDPEHYRAKRYVTQTLATEREVEDDVMVRSTNNESWDDDLLSRMQQTKFPFDRYHPPHGIDYYLKGALLGSVVLLRDRSKSAIPDEALERMDDLRPFMEFAFTYCIARHQLAHPEKIFFEKRMKEIIKEHSLSKTEGEVLTLRLTGKSYKEVASSMSISVDTVRSHIKEIRKKTGVRNPLKLFAKYFTPLVTPHKKS